MIAFLLVACFGALAQAQTVALYNRSSHGSNTDLFVGDAWEIDLYGTAGAAIGVNGVDTGVTIGSMGTQQFTGVIQAGSEGSNQQFWTVGGVPASPSPLAFTVEPAPAGSCASVAFGSTNPTDATIYSTDILGRYSGSVQTVSMPSSVHAIASIDGNMPTCSVSQYSVWDNNYPAFLYSQGTYINGNTVDTELRDHGCQYDPLEIRACNWTWDWQYKWPQDFDYPIFNQLEVEVLYFDRYYNQIYSIPPIWVYLFVDYAYGF